MNKYIDAHSHNAEQEPGIVKSYIYDFENDHFIPENNSFFIGIHPWFINKINWDQFVKCHEKYSHHHNYLGIGEIGLDKIHNDTFQKQIFFFKKSCEFSKLNNTKRIVIHNVKADQEIFSILKDYQINSKILLHDYNSHHKVFEQFNSLTDTYISIGSKLFTNDKIKNELKNIPINKILLETDDQIQYSIKDIYLEFSKIVGKSESKVKGVMSENYKNFIS